MAVCVNVENPERAEAQKLANLEPDGLQLVSLHALKHAADKGIAFIDKLEPSLKGERPS